MPKQYPIERSEGVAELRLAWDNRKARHDKFQLWFFLLFWVVWAPATGFATWMIFRSDSPVFFSIWCVFGWMGTIGIPYALLQRSWYESVVFSSDEFVHGRKGRLAPKPKRIPVSAISEIGIGFYEPNDRESVVTLNIHYFTAKKRKVRHMVGYWLHASLKEEVFCELQAFADKHHLAVAFQRY